MTEKNIEQFKKLLLEARAMQLDLGETLKESTKTVELDQTMVGRLSRIDALQGQQMALEVSRRRKQQLIGIGAALRRIDNGNYGICLECDEEINVRRLNADPANPKCINCAE